MTQNLIVDASHHNSTVNFSQVKVAHPNNSQGQSSNVKGVILKSSDGTASQGNWFNPSARAAANAGLHLAAYHWIQPLEDTLAQIQTFSQVVSASGTTMNLKSVVPTLGNFALDVEPTMKRKNGPDLWLSLTAAERADKIIHALNHGLELLGEVPGIYTNGLWWDLNIAKPISAHEPARWADLVNLLGASWLWDSRYTTKQSDLARVPKGWPRKALIQFTETGQCSGLSGHADLSEIL